MRFLAPVFCAVGLLLVPPTGWAATLHVPGDYATVCEATGVAAYGDTVLVGPGIHDYRYYQCVPIPDGVAVVSEAGPEQTILNAWEFGPIIGNGLIEFERGAGSLTALVGFTIYCSDISGAAVASAILCLEASPTIANNVIRPSPEYSFALDSSTGIACADGGTPRIVNNTILRVGDPSIPGSSGTAIWLRDTSPLMSHNIIAYSRNGIGCLGSSDPTISCNDMWSVERPYAGHCSPAEDDFFDDPLFCNPDAGDYTLDCSSPAVHGHGCGLVGALPVGCGASATQRDSWGTIKFLFR